VVPGGEGIGGDGSVGMEVYVRPDRRPYHNCQGGLGRVEKWNNKRTCNVWMHVAQKLLKFVIGSRLERPKYTVRKNRTLRLAEKARKEEDQPQPPILPSRRRRSFAKPVSGVFMKFLQEKDSAFGSLLSSWIESFNAETNVKEGAADAAAVACGEESDDNASAEDEEDEWVLDTGAGEAPTVGTRVLLLSTAPLGIISSSHTLRSPGDPSRWGTVCAFREALGHGKRWRLRFDAAPSCGRGVERVEVGAADVCALAANATAAAEESGVKRKLDLRDAYVSAARAVCYSLAFKV